MLKAWMILLIVLAIVPITWVSISESIGYGTGRGFAYDLESAFASLAIPGGIILGFYYLYKRDKKKTISP